MPFTFAHPAIILPLKKRLVNLSLTGLIIGSMAPDFEYFIQLRPVSIIGHSIIGVFIFNLPMVLIISYLFHRVVKLSFIAHLPYPLCYWLQDIALYRWRIRTIKELFIFMISSTIGIGTHLIWDAFTHNTGFVVTKAPFLLSTLRVMTYNIPIYKILQHGGTLLGLFIILLYLYINRSKESKKHLTINWKDKLKYWSLIIMITAFILGLRIAFFNYTLSVEYIGIYIVTFMTGFMLSILTASLLFRRSINSAF